MDLETFRTRRRLSYKELADLIGVSQPKQARSYALGHAWPRAAQVQKILSACKGVTVAGMHRRRVDFLDIAQNSSAA